MKCFYTKICFTDLYFVSVPPRVEIVDPCNPSPCGSNAVCNNRQRAAACQCIPEYFGDPYVACRPECVVNSDCPSNKACQRNKCIDPCPGTCGINAQCQVRSHIPTCTCIEGYIGDPFTECRLKPLGKFFMHLVGILACMNVIAFKHDWSFNVLPVLF